jgi:ribosomal protein S19E (S16A)
MGGVSVKDVDAQKFINAYAAFLKRQGKLPMYVLPSAHVQCRMLTFPQSRFVPTRWVKEKPESRNWGIIR